jgi:biopolymer transport protein ExbB/TolQ
LFAAIPAVIFYNHLAHQVREFGSRMDDFILEMLNAVERYAPAPSERERNVSMAERS